MGLNLCTDGSCVRKRLWPPDELSESFQECIEQPNTIVINQDHRNNNLQTGKNIFKKRDSVEVYRVRGKFETNDLVVNETEVLAHRQQNVEIDRISPESSSDTPPLLIVRDSDGALTCKPMEIEKRVSQLSHNAHVSVDNLNSIMNWAQCEIAHNSVQSDGTSHPSVEEFKEESATPEPDDNPLIYRQRLTIDVECADIELSESLKNSEDRSCKTEEDEPSTQSGFSTKPEYLCKTEEIGLPIPSKYKPSSKTDENEHSAPEDVLANEKLTELRTFSMQFPHNQRMSKEVSTTTDEIQLFTRQPVSQKFCHDSKMSKEIFTTADEEIRLFMRQPATYNLKDQLPEWKPSTCDDELTGDTSKPCKIESTDNEARRTRADCFIHKWPHELKEEILEEGNVKADEIKLTMSCGSRDSVTSDLSSSLFISGRHRALTIPISSLDNELMPLRKKIKFKDFGSYVIPAALDTIKNIFLREDQLKLLYMSDLKSSDLSINPWEDIQEGGFITNVKFTKTMNKKVFGIKIKNVKVSKVLRIAGDDRKVRLWETTSQTGARFCDIMFTHGIWTFRKQSGTESTLHVELGLEFIKKTNIPRLKKTMKKETRKEAKICGDRMVLELMRLCKIYEHDNLSV